MFVVVSRKGRFLMGRLEKGDDILTGIVDACRNYSVRCAEVRALGALQEVELAIYDQRRKDYITTKRFVGDLEILNATGNVTEKDGDLFCHLHVTLARETDNGLEVLGGHLLSGKVFACEFTLTTCDDLILRRLPDKTTGLALWKDAITLDQPAEAEGDDSGRQTEAAESWKDVLAQAVEQTSEETSATGRARGGQREEASRAQESAPAPAEPEATPPAQEAEPASLAEEWPEPEVGDLVLHPKFGKCTVERVEEGSYIQVRLPNRRLVRLGLEVVKLKLVGYESERQVFEAILPKPGKR